MTPSTTSRSILATLVLGLLPVVATADGQWVVGGAVGTAGVRESFAGADFEPSDTSFSLYGGYQFGKHFALQAGYLDLGSFDETIMIDGSPIRVAGDVDGFTVAALARLPVGKRFDAHARLGSYFYDVAGRVDDVRDDTGEADVFFGIGLGVNLTERFAVSVDAERYKLGAAHANVFSLGFQLSLR